MSIQDQRVSNAPVPRRASSVPSENSCSEPLFSVGEAAKHLGMSAKWVYRNYKRLNPVLIGDGPKPRIKFRRCDLDAWVRRHRLQ